MNIIELFSEIQANPRNKRAYRRLIDFYESNNMENEANAFRKVLDEVLGFDGTHSHEEQLENDPEND